MVVCKNGQTRADTTNTREVETDEELEEVPRVSSAKALEAIETLQLYEEQAQDGKDE